MNKKKNKKKNKWYNITYFNCDCFSPDHLIRFFENYDENSLMLEMILPPNGFFKRTYDAIKYIIGFRVFHRHEFIFNRDELKDVLKLLSGYCEEVKSTDMYRYKYLATNTEHELFLNRHNILPNYDEIILEVAFKKQNIWNRLKKAIRHISGKNCIYGIWDGWKLDSNAVCRFKKIMERHIKSVKEAEDNNKK